MTFDPDVSGRQQYSSVAEYAGYDRIEPRPGRRRRHRAPWTGMMARRCRLHYWGTPCRQRRAVRRSMSPSVRCSQNRQREQYREQDRNCLLHVHVFVPFSSSGSNLKYYMGFSCMRRVEQSFLRSKCILSEKAAADGTRRENPETRAKAPAIGFSPDRPDPRTTCRTARL